MKLSAAFLNQCGADTGYPPSTLEKVAALGEVAAAVARHPLLGGALTLKGGTALNLCSGQAPARLSVDLDYNYVAQPGREAMLAQRPGIEQALETLVQRLGFRLQRSADAFAGRKFYAHYPSAFGAEDRVEIDLNFLWRVPLDDPRQAAMWQPGELDRPAIPVVAPLELCVGKLLAFLDRTAPRDVWDTIQLPILAPSAFQSPLLRPLFIAFSAMLPHPLTAYGRDQLAARLTPGDIRDQLLPMLAASGGADAADLMEQAWTVAAPLLGLGPNEQAYVDAVQEGVPRLDLLFPDDPDRARRIAQHPVILWKLKNVRQQKGRPDPGPQ